MKSVLFLFAPMFGQTLLQILFVGGVVYLSSYVKMAQVDAIQQNFDRTAVEARPTFTEDDVKNLPSFLDENKRPLAGGARLAFIGADITNTSNVPIYNLNYICRMETDGSTSKIYTDTSAMSIYPGEERHILFQGATFGIYKAADLQIAKCKLYFSFNNKDYLLSMGRSDLVPNHALTVATRPQLSYKFRQGGQFITAQVVAVNHFPIPVDEVKISCAIATPEGRIATGFMSKKIDPVRPGESRAVTISGQIQAVNDFPPAALDCWGD
jgi:hypothetical protein